MKEPLPWDNPNHDVGADLVETTARWIASPSEPDQHDIETAAAFCSATFGVSAASTHEAMRRIGDAARKMMRDIGPKMMDFLSRTRPEPAAWKRVDRIAGLYGPVTHRDLNIDTAQVAEQAGRALAEQQTLNGMDYRVRIRCEVGRLPSERDLQVFLPLDYYFTDRTVFRHAARQNGKTSQLESDIAAWAEMFEQVIGETAYVIHPGCTGPDNHRALVVR